HGGVRGARPSRCPGCGAGARRCGEPRRRMRPLVSVVTRTLGRPCLADVAASLSDQTHRPLQWVIVNASGQPLEAVPSAAGVATLVVSEGRRLPRAQALNAGLAAA